MANSELQELCNKIHRDCRDIRIAAWIILAECIVAFLIAYPIVVCHMLG